MNKNIVGEPSKLIFALEETLLSPRFLKKDVLVLILNKTAYLDEGLQA